MPTQATTGQGGKNTVLAQVARMALASLPALTTAAGLMLSPADKPAVTTSVAQSDILAIPVPMLAKGHPVQWFFVFKLNASVFPKCGDGVDTRACAFDGNLKPADYKEAFGQRYLVSSNEAPALVDGGPQCVGTTTSDPVGATFDEVYNGNFHYVLWNDQFFDSAPDPATTVLNCSKGDCGEPWGHSKGLLAWNDAGEGMVMQVSTPSWPGSGNPQYQRTHGNTLGCIVDDDDVGVSQHFFALRLTRDDIVKVLKGMQEASVPTDPTNAQVAGPQPIGGPPEVVAEVMQLGKKSDQNKLDPLMPETLSSGIQFIVKPSRLHVPPWQMVSALLGGVSLRTATWAAKPFMPSTTVDTAIGCWDDSIHGKAGGVEIATTGSWGTPAKPFSLTYAAGGTNGNHAKLGVSTSPNDHYAIFGDENQQGSIDKIAATADDPDGCGSSQNGRGGMFFVMQNAALSTSLSSLLTGQSAPLSGAQ